jgi:preprotein translocase subunit SecE
MPRRFSRNQQEAPGRLPGTRSPALTDKERRSRKQNFIQNWYRETVGELRKVSWPTGPEARRLTGLVLLVMVIMGIILGGVDLLAREALNLLLGVA